MTKRFWLTFFACIASVPCTLLAADLARPIAERAVHSVAPTHANGGGIHLSDVSGTSTYLIDLGFVKLELSRPSAAAHGQKSSEEQVIIVILVDDDESSWI